MPHDLKKSVWDALEACRMIQEFTAGRTLASYQADTMRHLAVERLFTILGEAFKRIDEAAPSFRAQFPETGKIIGTRNRVMHDYDSVDDDILWLAVENQIPALVNKLAAWLDEITTRNAPQA